MVQGRTGNFYETTTAQNQLFIVCPFSCLESRLTHQYGLDKYFLTYSGAIVQYHDYHYISEVREFITREGIRSITVVNDTSCRFINNIIKRAQCEGFPAEKHLEELYVENYIADFKGRNLEQQQLKLAELNVIKQIENLADSTILGSYIAENGIIIKGLVTSKNNNLFKQIHLVQNELVY